jgi:hypothetical protein
MRAHVCRVLAVCTLPCPEAWHLLSAADVQPAFDAAIVQAELREKQPDVVAAAQSFTAPTAVRSHSGVAGVHPHARPAPSLLHA